MESHGTFRTLLNPIKQLMLRRSKLAIYGTSRSDSALGLTIPVAGV